MQIPYFPTRLQLSPRLPAVHSISLKAPRLGSLLGPLHWHLRLQLVNHVEPQGHHTLHQSHHYAAHTPRLTIRRTPVEDL